MPKEFGTLPVFEEVLGFWQAGKSDFDPYSKRRDLEKCYRKPFYNRKVRTPPKKKGVFSTGEVIEMHTIRCC